MFDRRLVENFNWGLLLAVTAIGTIGILLIYSAVNAGIENPQKALSTKQLIWFGIGYLIMFISVLFSYKNLDRWGMSIYVVCIIMLLCVLFFGKYVAGARRWLTLGSLTIQPSEFVKISVIIVLAKYYSANAMARGLTFRNLLKPAVLVGIPVFLVLRQPDLGTSLIIIIIAISMTLFVKIEKKTLITLALSVMAFIPIVWSFVLKPYQRERVMTLLNPDLDPLGKGYQILQSKIAIGSGMLYGKGFLKGTQNALSFLPEQQTDFILCVLAEEWGFTGVGVVVALYLLLLGLALNIAHACRDPFGIILTVGIISMIFWHIIINMGMVMGLLPVVGAPLPLISYGGSSVLATLMGIGILLNISMRRFVKM